MKRTLVLHRRIKRTQSTYCGKPTLGLTLATGDRDTTCRTCLRALGAYERRRLELAEWERQ